MSDTRIFMQHDAILDVLNGMAQDLKQYLSDQHIDKPAMIGILTGGSWVAEYLHSIINIHDPLGTLDISFYRDDFTRIGMNPKVKPSNIPFDVNNRHIILVDDVIQSGRTIRASMNEIFDFGRPASITLVTLINRNGRELPIQAEIVGLNPTLDISQQIKLIGPDNLTLKISDLSEATLS